MIFKNMSPVLNFYPLYFMWEFIRSLKPDTPKALSLNLESTVRSGFFNLLIDDVLKIIYY